MSQIHVHYKYSTIKNFHKGMQFDTPERWGDKIELSSVSLFIAHLLLMIGFRWNL